jgi:hypothetical protein
MYIETAQHAKQVSSVTRPLHTRLGTHAKLSPRTVTDVAAADVYVSALSYDDHMS